MSYQLSNWEVDTIRDNLSINETGTIMSYSGRAMYGAECLGIVTDNVARMSMLLASALAVIGGRAYDLITELTDTEIRTDSMARDIVVYFPNITLPDDFVDEDDE
jgi:hypothetical protein